MAETAMARYELLLLTVPEMTVDEASMIESQFHSLITNAKGEVISFERWGKYRLAYQVNNSEYGIYFLARFELPTATLRAVLEEIRLLSAVRYSDLVMRHVITRLDLSTSLTYKRPESLEDAPRRDYEHSRHTTQLEEGDITFEGAAEEAEEELTEKEA